MIRRVTVAILRDGNRRDVGVTLQGEAWREAGTVPLVGQSAPGSGEDRADSSGDVPDADGEWCPAPDRPLSD